MFYLIMYLNQFEFWTFFICQVNALPTYCSLLFNMFFPCN